MKLATGNIHRYIGDSFERKPMPGEKLEDGTTIDRTGNKSIPAGSSFLEEDTGRIFRWTGQRWVAPPVPQPDPRIDVLLDEIQALREELTTGLPVPTNALGRIR